MPLLEVRNLVKEFSRTRGWFAPPSIVRAVDDVSFTIERGRNVRARRRIRQRQNHDRPMHPAARRADVGRGPFQRRGRAWVFPVAHASRAPRHADRLPGSVLLPQSTHAGRRHRRRAAHHPSHRAQTGETCASRGAVRAGRARRVTARQVSAPVQRRTAPAHRARPRTRAESFAHHRGRTGIGAGRFGPGTGHQPADGPAGSVEADISLHRARSQARAPHLQPRRGDVPGKDRRDGGRPMRSLPHRRILTRVRCCLRFRCRIRAPHASASCSKPRRSAARRRCAKSAPGTWPPYRRQLTAISSQLSVISSQTISSQLTAISS